jgi:hypothetical protein
MPEEYVKLGHEKYCHEQGVWVTYKTGSGLDDWIYCIVYIRNSGLQVI